MQMGEKQDKPAVSHPGRLVDSAVLILGNCGSNVLDAVGALEHDRRLGAVARRALMALAVFVAVDGIV